jgi:mono/diheme cytochrome c family protein
MKAYALIESQADFERWISSSATKQLGRSEWVGACAKCHGLKGQGDYGPQIASSPLLTDRKGLETILLNGRDQPNVPGVMPPVADGWTKQQLDALFTYVGAKVAGGGGGG